jgi:hypothetical protein
MLNINDNQKNVSPQRAYCELVRRLAVGNDTPSLGLTRKVLEAAEKNAADLITDISIHLGQSNVNG